MASQAQIKQAEERRTYWQGKLKFRQGKLAEWKASGDRGHDWERKHQAAHDAAGVKSAQASIERARGEIRKWKPLVDEAQGEVSRYDKWLGENKPKQTAQSSVGAQEAALAKAHPETRDGIRKVVAQVKAQFPDLVVTSTTGGVHAAGSLHYQGRAMDLASDRMDGQAQWITQHMTGKLAEGIHNRGLSVKNGNQVPSSYWGTTTWNNHTNHIHLGV